MLANATSRVRFASRSTRRQRRVRPRLASHVPSVPGVPSACPKRKPAPPLACPKRPRLWPTRAHAHAVNLPPSPRAHIARTYRCLGRLGRLDQTQRPCGAEGVPSCVPSASSLGRVRGVHPGVRGEVQGSTGAGAGLCGVCRGSLCVASARPRAPARPRGHRRAPARVSPHAPHRPALTRIRARTGAPHTPRTPCTRSRARASYLSLFFEGKRRGGRPLYGYTPSRFLPTSNAPHRGRTPPLEGTGDEPISVRLLSAAGA